MRTIKKSLIALVLLLGLAPLALAYQQQNGETELNNNGSTTTVTKGLNLANFPVKDVTMAAFNQIGILQSYPSIEDWIAAISADGKIPRSIVLQWEHAGESSCEAKLGGRRYIVNLGGNTTTQSHFITMGNPVQGSTTPTNIQNYQAGSQVDLTRLFCAVYKLEYVAQAAQIHNGYLGGYIPLCELTQGNSCGLANDEKVNKFVKMHAQACIPGVGGGC